MLVAVARLPSSSARKPYVGDARKPTTVKNSCAMLVASARLPSSSAREIPDVGDADVSKPRAENKASTFETVHKSSGVVGGHFRDRGAQGAGALCAAQRTS